MSDAKCVECGRSNKERPICFRGEPWCSDRCRKRFKGEEVSVDEQAEQAGVG